MPKLVHYVIEGDIAAVRAKLQKRWWRRASDPNEPNATGYTPLWYAAYLGNLAMLELLVANGADPNRPVAHGLTPLCAAVIMNRTNIMSALVSAGVDLRTCFRGRPAVYFAVINGYSDSLGTLLDAGGDANSTRDDVGTLLHCVAVRHQKTDNALDAKTAHVLLSHGAIVDAVNPEGATPLHFAAQFGHHELASVLLEYGANPNAKQRTRTPEAIQAGMTPLHLASWQGHTKIVKLLLASGSAINEADDAGMTALAWAQKELRQDVVSLLRTHVATPQSGRREPEGPGSRSIQGASIKPKELWPACEKCGKSSYDEEHRFAIRRCFSCRAAFCNNCIERRPYRQVSTHTAAGGGECCPGCGSNSIQDAVLQRLMLGEASPYVDAYTDEVLMRE